MPQKHRIVKRPTVLAKRTQCLRAFSKIKSYKPLCEKLKINNSSLAKALSKEKQESQLLFSQNVALIAEVQDLGLACSKRDAVISNVLKNAKEMFKMLVTMTGYLTNTISSCQEFATSSVTNLRMSCSSAGKRDSYRRLSTKSPTRGVVKPMVSGHTITKPTINLSRVNIQHINNPSNLSIIEEVATPPRTQELNTSRSPVVVPMRPRRYETTRTCRLPERLTVTSPRSSDENERRLSKRRSKHSGRMSGKFLRPKSSRLSGANSTRSSIENFERLGSPRVKLNDVSKLLQNSQSINIRMLSENQNDQVTENTETSDDANPENSQTAITIPESSPEDDGTEDDNNKTIESKNEQTDNEESDVTDQQIQENSDTVQNLSSTWEDPLEGPSWLFNNSETVPCEDQKTDDDVNDSSNDSACSTLKVTALCDVSNGEKSRQQPSPLPLLNKRGAHAQNSKKSNQENNEEYAVLQRNENDDTFCNISTVADPPDTDEGGCKREDEHTVNLENFVTQRRGYFESEDEDDDFTLMYVRQPRNMHFDINDLKLPVLEESTIRPVAAAEPEPEITTTLRKISQICPIPFVSSSRLDESMLNQSTVKLPIILNNDYDDKNETTPFKAELKSRKRKKKVKKVTLQDSSDYIETSPMYNKRNGQKSKKDTSVNKDPSAAKVVLQKLNESEVKSRTPSPEQTSSHEIRQSLSPLPMHTHNSSDSESSYTSSSSYMTLNRPRRKRAPVNLHEPSLKKKLRSHRK